MLAKLQSIDSGSVNQVNGKTESSKCLNCGKSDSEIHHTSCRCKSCGEEVLQQEWSEHQKVCPSSESCQKDEINVPEDIIKCEKDVNNKVESESDIKIVADLYKIKSKLIKIKTLEKEAKDASGHQRELNINETKIMSTKDMEQLKADAIKLKSDAKKNESALNILGEQAVISNEQLKIVKHERNKDVKKVQEKESSLSSDMEKLNARVIDTGKKIDVLEYKNLKGIIMWKIENFSVKIIEGKSGNYIYLSLPVFTASQEYKFCLSMYVFRENARRDKYYMAVKINILRSPYNDVLQWPMKRKVLLTLLNPQDRGSNFHKSFYCNFDKPTDRNESKHATGIANFMPLERMQEYIFKNDCVYIKCELATY